MTLFNFYSCSQARVRLNGAVYPANIWTPTVTPDEGDTSNFEAGGVTDAINCLLTCRVQLEIIIDGSNNPWDEGLMVPTPAEGPYPTNLALYLNGITTVDGFVGPRWLFPLYLIGETSAPSDVKSFGKGTVKIRNKGPWFYPTGAIA